MSAAREAHARAVAVREVWALAEARSRDVSLSEALRDEATAEALRLSFEYAAAVDEVYEAFGLGVTE